MNQIHEIAPDVFRLSVYVPDIDMQFNHFLVRDQEPLLFHAGLKSMFPALREAVATLIDPASLRHIAWSHFESDECGALNEWLAIAPRAEAACGELGANVNIQDFASRPPRALKPGEVVQTGRHRFQWVPTPHLPHGWDAGVLFDETTRVLFCSDLFHQLGKVEPITSGDVVGRWEQAVATYQNHPVLMDYLPFTPQTRRHLEKLASLEPKVLAAMHGSAFVGDGSQALRASADVLERLLGAPVAAR